MHFKKHVNISNRPKYSGFGLIEVAISMFIICITAAGIAKLLLTERRAQTDIQTRNLAIMLLNDMAGRIASNSLGAINNAYNVAIPSTMPTTTCTGVGNLSCTASQIAVYDLWDWGQYVQALLPANSSASITLTKASSANNRPVYTIRISWNNSKNEVQQTSMQVSPP